jgi:hypothetical protein
LTVRRGDSGDWWILPGRNRKVLPVKLCPCCDLPFKNADAARRVASFLYPMEAPKDAA